MVVVDKVTVTPEATPLGRRISYDGNSVLWGIFGGMELAVGLTALFSVGWPGLLLIVFAAFTIALAFMTPE